MKLGIPLSISVTSPSTSTSKVPDQATCYCAQTGAYLPSGPDSLEPWHQLYGLPCSDALASLYQHRERSPNKPLNTQHSRSSAAPPPAANRLFLVLRLSGHPLSNSHPQVRLESRASMPAVEEPSCLLDLVSTTSLVRSWYRG